MAQRRMFSMKIVDTDAFMDMPQSSQLLYFHLAMRADDDGFVANPRRIMRSIGSQDDDYKVLIAKKFILPFESGICVIKHWLIHNLVRSDRYIETQYVREKATLIIDPKTKKYSLNKGEFNVIPNGNQMEPQVRLELGKDSLGKVKESFALFWEEYPNKKAKKIALRNWLKIKPDEPLFKRIMQALGEQKKSEQWTKDNGKFIPHPSSWLNQERWEDEIKKKDFETGGKAGKFANIGTKI